MIYENNLENLLFKRSLSQTEFAEKVGAPYGSVAHWKSGRYRIPQKYIPIVCKTLSCTKEELFRKSYTSEELKMTTIRRINIFLFMESEKINIAELARKLETSKQYISSLFFSEKLIPVSLIEKIAKKYNLPLNHFNEIPDLRNRLVKDKIVNPKVLEAQQAVMDKLHFKSVEHKKAFAPLIYNWISLYIDDDGNIEKDLEIDEIKLKTKQELLKITKNNE